jgi:hypothetical protein
MHGTPVQSLTIPNGTDYSFTVMEDKKVMMLTCIDFKNILVYDLRNFGMNA